MTCHQNYELSARFFVQFEAMAPSPRVVGCIRAHPTYTAYQRRWQLPVYFQLRWKEITGKLEEALSVAAPSYVKGRFKLPSLQPHDCLDQKMNPHSFFTLQAVSVANAAEACWSDNVYLADLGHKFWKLTLQACWNMTRKLTSDF